jgi:ABC-2 type transport system permease protein
MVAHLLRLKLTLLRNGLKRSPWQLVGLAFGGLYALGIVGMCLVLLVLLR